MAEHRHWYRPTRRFLGLTWLGWLNFVIAQWVGVRLIVMVVPDDDPKIAPHSRGRVIGVGLAAMIPFTRWPFIGIPGPTKTLFMVGKGIQRNDGVYLHVHAKWPWSPKET